MDEFDSVQAPATLSGSAEAHRRARRSKCVGAGQQKFTDFLRNADRTDDPVHSAAGCRGISSSSRWCRHRQVYVNDAGWERLNAKAKP
jgi:hypothetical protein